MLKGVSLFEGTHHVDGSDLVAAVDAWAVDAGGYPDLVPIWCPLGTDGIMPRGRAVNIPLMRQLQTRGIEPMAYAHSVGWNDESGEANYRSYLRGQHDAMLDRWAQDAADYGDRLIVRLDHEQAMTWCPWCNLDPELYKDAFSYIAEKLHQAPNVKLYWCGWGTTPYQSLKFYPEGAADFAGFDKYSTRKGWIPLRKDWQHAIDAMRRRTRKPLIVGEFGRAARVPKRGRWIRSLRNVKGVWAAVYFDIDMRFSNQDVDWTMTRWMRRKFLAV